MPIVTEDVEVSVFAEYRFASALVQGRGFEEPAPRHRSAIAWRDATDAARLVADQDAAGIRVFVADPASLASATAVERAGMVSVLANQTWMDLTDEQTAMTLIRYGGAATEVLALVDAAGELQDLQDGVDDPGLAAELATLLGGAPAARAPTEPLARAVQTGSSEAVLGVDDLGGATDRDRVAAIRVLVSDWVVTESAESKAIDILASSQDLRGVMTELRGLGLVESLFDSIDNTLPQARLVALLSPLGDDQINQDLEVFESNWLYNAARTLGGGVLLLGEAVWNDPLGTAWELFKGMTQPLWDPLGTVAHLWEQMTDLVKSFSMTLEWLDRLVTFVRDLSGTIATWSLAITAAASALAAFCVGAAGLFLETAVGAVVFGALAAFFATVAEYGLVVTGAGGAIFLVSAGIRFVIDMVQGASATTRRQADREQEDISEDLMIGMLTALSAFVFKGLQAKVEVLQTWLAEVRKKGSRADAAPPPPDFQDAPAEVERLAVELEEAAQRAQGEPTSERTTEASREEGELRTPVEEPVIVEEAQSLDGERRVQIDENRTCRVCASPCDAVWKKYAKELAANSRLADRLRVIERMTNTLDQLYALRDLEQELADIREMGEVSGGGEESLGDRLRDKWEAHQDEYPDLDGPDDYVDLINSIVADPVHKKPLSRERTAYLGRDGTVVIDDPKGVEGGTAFRPSRGKAYYDDLR